MTRRLSFKGAVLAPSFKGAVLAPSFKGAVLARIACAALMSASVHCSSPAMTPESVKPASPTAPLRVAVSVSDGRYLMGTVLDVTLVGDDAEALRSHLDWVFDRVAELEGVASRHRPDSELSRLNARAGGPLEDDYSADLRALLVHSLDAAKRTDGAFDVTVGPLIELWIDAVERDVWPTESDLIAARSRVGTDAITLAGDGRLGLSQPGRSIDFGGIGKGFALDVVRAGLLERGVTRGLLDFGGSSVWAMGSAPDGGPWLLEVDAREEPGAGPPRVMALTDRALSVSSSLGESSAIGGRTVGHVIDPRTGETVISQRTAVVVGVSATEAEVWSTALLVLAPGHGTGRVSEASDVEAWVRFADGSQQETVDFNEYWESVRGGAE